MSTARGEHWAGMGEFTFEAGMWLLWGVHRLFGRLPFRITLYPVVVWYWATRPAARAASLQYLQRIEAAHGALCHQPGWRDTFRHFFAFADTLLDKMLAIGGHYPFDQVEIRGRGLLAQTRDGTGGIIVTAHVGCLELCRALGEQKRPGMLVLVHTRHAERFNVILRRLNPASRVELLQVTEIDPGTAARLAAHVERGGLVTIVGDRVPVQASKTVSVPFLGHDAPLPVGAYVLAALLRCPLYFMACVRQERAHSIVFDRLAERIELPRGQRDAVLREHAVAYVQRLEAVLKQAPFEWFNFFDFWDQDAGGAETDGHR